MRLEDRCFNRVELFGRTYCTKITLATHASCLRVIRLNSTKYGISCPQSIFLLFPHPRLIDFNNRSLLFSFNFIWSEETRRQRCILLHGTTSCLFIWVLCPLGFKWHLSWEPGWIDTVYQFFEWLWDYWTPWESVTTCIEYRLHYFLRYYGLMCPHDLLILCEVHRLCILLILTGT